MIQVLSHSTSLNMFLLVTSFHVPDHHLWQAIPLRRWAAEAGTYTPGLGRQQNRELRSREKNKLNLLLKLKAKPCLLHIHGGSHTLCDNRRLGRILCLCFSQLAKRKDDSAEQRVPTKQRSSDKTEKTFRASGKRRAHTV